MKELYDKLHQAGVIHGDVEPRHIRRRIYTDDLCLIDFDHGFEVDHERGWEIEKEKALLDGKLGVRSDIDERHKSNSSELVRLDETDDSDRCIDSP